MYLSPVWKKNFSRPKQCVTTPAALEEERRLFYVALTRAEKRAFMSFATSRYKNGQVVSSRPSRFIGEIDQEFLEGYIAMREEPSGFKLKTTTAMSGLHKPAITLNKPATIDIPAIDRSKLKPIDSNQVVPGMIIFHPTFGAGKVINLEGLGVQKKAKVVFREGGSRTLLIKICKIIHSSRLKTSVRTLKSVYLPHNLKEIPWKSLFYRITIFGLPSTRRNPVKVCK